MQKCQYFIQTVQLNELIKSLSLISNYVERKNQHCYTIEAIQSTIVFLNFYEKTLQECNNEEYKQTFLSKFSEKSNDIL